MSEKNKKIEIMGFMTVLVIYPKTYKHGILLYSASCPATITTALPI